MLASCTSDPEAEPQSQGEGVTIALAASATPYEEVTTRATTRAWTWTPPENYYNYDGLYSSTDEYQSLENKAIDVFLTYGTNANYHGALRYYSSKKTWQFVGRDAENKIIEDIETNTYYVYGFIPRDAAAGASLALLPSSSTYADGAVLTIQGLETVATDACVIIGAREGFRVATDTENGIDYDGGYTDANGNGSYDEGETRINRLRRGYFGFDFKGGESEENYLFLLFDHLYSALRIKMKVDGEYNALRHIKLKSIYLASGKADGTATKKKANVTITLNATDGSDPLKNATTNQDQIVYEYEPTCEQESGGTVFQSATGKFLTTTYQSFVGQFMPADVTILTVTSTYDVYDTNDNLIRENCTATNKINAAALIGEFGGFQRGNRYSIDMTIRPTYLYMMSDPDLDNPTVVVSGE